MPGRVPGIHVFLWLKVVDSRDKPGHDGPIFLTATTEIILPAALDKIPIKSQLPSAR